MVNYLQGVWNESVKSRTVVFVQAFSQPFLDIRYTVYRGAGQRTSEISAPGGCNPMSSLAIPNKLSGGSSLSLITPR